MALRKLLSNTWNMLKEDWENPLVSPTPPLSQRLPPVPSEDTHGSDPLAITTLMHANLTGLASQHSQFQVHLATLAQALAKTPHQPTLTVLLRLLSSAETTLEALQTDQIRLERTLHEKRLLLRDQEQKYTKMAAEKAVVLQTLKTLLQDRAQEARTLQHLQESNASLEQELVRIRAEYSTLSHAHDDLVGKYHTLFIDSQQRTRIGASPQD